MEDRRVDENLDFEDLRHVGSVSPTTLANQYRLSQKPRRPEKKKIARKKKLSSGSHDDEIPHSASMRHLSTASSHDWLLNMDEEDFDFDGMYTRQKFQLHRLLICPWCGPFIENGIKTQRCRCNYHLRMLWSNFGWNEPSGCISATSFFLLKWPKYFVLSELASQFLYSAIRLMH